MSVMTNQEPSITLRISKTFKIRAGYELLAEKIFNVTAKKCGDKTSSKKTPARIFKKGFKPSCFFKYLTLNIILDTISILLGFSTVVFQKSPQIT